MIMHLSSAFISIAVLLRTEGPQEGTASLAKQNRPHTPGRSIAGPRALA
jgi:hypothetical protein